MGEIHELFVLALSLVWFAGATPEGHCKRGLFAGEISRISGISKLESLENGRILLCFHSLAVL